MVQQILGNVINLTQKAPISLVTKHYKMGNCEEELPKKPVGRLSVNCWPTVDRQVTDSLPTANQQVKKKEKLC